MENGVSFAFFFAILVFAKNLGVVKVRSVPKMGQIS